jgi:hypothetical protein
LPHPQLLEFHHFHIPLVQITSRAERLPIAYVCRTGLGPRLDVICMPARLERRAAPFAFAAGREEQRDSFAKIETPSPHSSLSFS